MNDLEKYFLENKDRLIHKWNHYFDIYDRHFSKFRNKEIVVLEIGVSQGGSLQMWKNYFGSNATIYGMDINPKCKTLEEENIKILIGSQSDRTFLQQVKREIPPIDILIDDGGHTMNQLITTFEELYPHIKENGIYAAEDLHSCYWSDYGGGYKRDGSFIEYSKNFIDSLNAFHSEQESFQVNDFTKSADSLHYYDSVLVIEKRRRDKAPEHPKTGNESHDNPKSLTRFAKKTVRYPVKVLNKILQRFRIKGI